MTKRRTVVISNSDKEADWIKFRNRKEELEAIEKAKSALKSDSEQGGRP